LLKDGGFFDTSLSAVPMAIGIIIRQASVTPVEL